VHNFSTLQNWTVLIISPLTSRQTSQLRCCLSEKRGTDTLASVKTSVKSTAGYSVVGAQGLKYTTGGNLYHTHIQHTGSVHLEKFARLCMVLATSVVFRDTFSVGSCCAKPKSVGERTAGHMKRRNTHELTSWSQTSWLLWLWQRCRNAENTRLSSLHSGHRNFTSVLTVQLVHWKSNSFEFDVLWWDFS